MQRRIKVIAGAGATLLIGLTAVAFARAGRQTTPPAPNFGPVHYQMDVLIQPIGWRNIQQGTGTLTSDVTTSSDSSSTTLEVSSDGSRQASAWGEAGFRVIWVGSGTPTASVPISVFKGGMVVGNRGIVRFARSATDPYQDQELNVVRDGLAGFSTSLGDEARTVALTQGSDGRFTGEFWVLMNPVRVESGLPNDLAKAGIMVQAGTPPEPYEEAEATGAN